jgi:N12 class adenine-specific DNA methylase
MKWVDLQHAGFKLFCFESKQRNFFLAKPIDPELVAYHEKTLKSGGFKYHEATGGYYAPIDNLRAQVILNLPGATSISVKRSEVQLTLKTKTGKQKHENHVSGAGPDTNRQVRTDSTRLPERDLPERVNTDVREPDNHQISGEHTERNSNSGDDSNERIKETERSTNQQSNIPESSTTDKLGPNNRRGGDHSSNAADDTPLTLNSNHYFINTEIDRDGGFQARKRYEENISAFEILQEIEESGQPATKEQKSKMVKFNGWGGLPDVFDSSSSKKWAQEAHIYLKEALSDDEYADAKDSVNNSHYTGPVVIRNIWKALKEAGFSGGNILETSMGIGNFFGLADPKIITNSSLVGIEKDTIPGRLAQKIYPDSKIYVKGYEKTRLPHNYFDLAISNVPFGQFSVYDPEYPELKKNSIHDYFFLKTIDKLKPNGIMAFITSSYTLDKRDFLIRKKLHEKAEFLGAVRLPVNNQRAQAGTDVSSDIIFLKKRDRPLALKDIETNSDWIHSSDMEIRDLNDNDTVKELSVNNYYHKHPEQVAGNFYLDRGEYGHFRVSVAETDEGLDSNLSDILQKMFKNISLESTPERLPEIETDLIEESVPLEGTIEVTDEFYGNKNFGSFVLNGDQDSVYQIVGKTEDGYQAQKTSLKGRPLERLISLLHVRDAMDELFNLEKETPVEHSLEQKESLQNARNRLNESYDSFVLKNGPLNTPANSRLFIDDPEFGRVMALEFYDEKHKSAQKADVFSQRVLAPDNIITSVDTPHDGLLISLDRLGKIDIPMIAELAHVSEKKVVENLQKSGSIFFDIDKENWVTSAEYLSGNVKVKLRNAQAAADLEPEKFQQNVVALLEVQPKDLNPSEIHVRFGAPWIPADVVKKFMIEKMDIPDYQAEDINVQFRRLDGKWLMTGIGSSLKSKIQAVNDYGTNRRNFFNLVEKALNQQSCAVYDTFEEGGKKTRVLNEKETIAAQQKMAFVKNEFQTFLWQDEKQGEELLKIYNDQFNNYVSPTYDGSHLTFPGMSKTLTPRDYQANAIWRGLQTGNILLGHEVGTGKTLEMIALAMESKRLGKAHKPMICVPNYMLEQITREAQQLYPSANILMVTQKDFQKDRRQAFMGKVANNNWDLVVVTHSMFGKIGINPEFEESLIKEEILNYEAELKASDKRYRIKKIEAKLKTLTAKLEQVQDNMQNKKDKGLLLDDMGIDSLFIDESHNFKNLDLADAGSDLSAGIQGSQRARDLYQKTRWLYDKRGETSGVCFSTGTPVSNNVFEIYNIQRYLQPDLLEERCVGSVNSWAASFLSPKQQWEPSPSGSGWMLRTRYEMVNIPELMKGLRSTMDVVRADDVNIKRPEMETVNITVPMNEQQQQYMKHLDERVNRIRNERVDPRIDNLLKIVSEGRKLALDPKLLEEHFEDAGIDICSEDNILWENVQKSKTDELSENVSQIYRNSMEQKGTQLVFCDIGTPGGKKPYNVYDTIREKLVKLGVPTEEIAFIHDYKSDAAKASLFKSVREGSIRVMIGSTAKMGEGVNVQARAVAIHHLDAPWRPSDIEQRDGRVKRFGNMFKNVQKFIYTTKDTFDLFMWNLLKVKAETFNRIMAGDDSIRTFEMNVDPTYAETAAITSSDDLIREKLEVDQELLKMEMLQRAHLDNSFLNKRRLRNQKSYLEDLKGSLNEIEQIPTPVDDPEIWTVDLKSYGYDEDFKGNREGALSCLAKIFNKNKINTIEGVTCGGIALTVDKHFDSNKGKNFTIWHIASGDMEFRRAAEIEKILKQGPLRISSLHESMEEAQVKIEKLESLVNLGFEHRDQLIELQNRQKAVEEKIKNAREPSSETDQEEPEKDEISEKEPLSSCAM